MEIALTNLRGEKAKDGKIYITVSAQELYGGRLVLAVIKGNKINWEADGIKKEGII
jgi:hypothetical protein